MIDSKELLFTVDEGNRPIEPVERKFAHANRVWHRVAHILVYRPDGRVLCEQRSLKKDQSPGKWNCVLGGHLSPGEEPVEGALKELREETGIVANEGDLQEFMLHKYTSKVSENREFQYVYLLGWDGSDDELRAEPDEIEQLAWRTTDELSQMVGKSPDWVYVGYEQGAFKRVNELVGARK